MRLVTSRNHDDGGNEMQNRDHYLQTPYQIVAPGTQNTLLLALRDWWYVEDSRRF